MTYLVSGKGADVSDNNNTAPRDIQFRVGFVALSPHQFLIKISHDSKIFLGISLFLP